MVPKTKMANICQNELPSHKHYTLGYFYANLYVLNKKNSNSISSAQMSVDFAAEKSLGFCRRHGLSDRENGPTPIFSLAFISIVREWKTFLVLIM